MLKVLYVFAGRRRKNSVAWYLKRLAARTGIHIEVVELDIQRDRKCDFTLPAVHKKWLQRISSGEFYAVLVTPPCSTFTRAVWANEAGPYPLRIHLFLRGFPWNAGARKDRAQFGNVLADFAYEALKRQFEREHSVGVMEQPEDLGRTKKERIPGHAPASMWQFHQFDELLGMAGVSSVVFSQLDFGLESVKPTRFLMRTDAPLHPAMFHGRPKFDEAGYYVGPLPRRVGKPMIGKEDGVFKTAAAAAWPPMLCKWTAEAIVTSYQRYREQGQGSFSQNSQKRGHEEEERMHPNKKMRLQVEEECLAESDPMAPSHPGGDGSPRSCWWKGEKKAFHDGGGLGSPGRWKKEKRFFPGAAKWEKLRKAIAGGSALLGTS